MYMGAHYLLHMKHVYVCSLSVTYETCICVLTICYIAILSTIDVY